MNVKKNFYIVIFFILFFVLVSCTSFFAGYQLCKHRLGTVSGDVIDRTEQLQQEISRLETELNDRVRELSEIESKLDYTESRVDECLGIARQLGDDLDKCREELRGSNPIITELRKRIVGYEEQARTMQGLIEQLQTSISQ